MTFLRNVLTDLVDKKLWPVAAGLLVALVAIPVVLTRGGGDEPLPAIPAAIQDRPSVVVSPADAGRGDGGDRPANDPFRVRPGASAGASAPTGTGAAPVVTASAGAGAGAAATAGRGAGGSAAGAPPSTPVFDVPGLDDIDVVPVDGTDTGAGDTGADRASEPARARAADAGSWHVDVRFGTAGSATTREDLARLSPLPSAQEPYFVFLGVAADGRTGLFLVTSDAHAAGEGRCVAGATECDRVELQAGDTATFDVATPGGRVVTYQLDLVKLWRDTSGSPEQARAARLRESDAGRAVLRNAVDTKQVDVSSLAYSAKLGLVVPSGRAAARTRALFGGFRVDLRFGTPGALVKRYNLARLTPLPSVDEPSFVYLGVLDDGETAIFLNPSEAHASGGEAVCEPSPTECHRVKLRSGQSATFDAPTLDGGTTRYQLDIDGVTPLEAETPEQAEASRRRESPAGRVILRRLVHEVGGLVEDLTFSGGKGVVEEEAPAAE